MQEEFHATALYGICSKSTVCKLIQEPVASQSTSVTKWSDPRRVLSNQYCTENKEIKQDYDKKLCVVSYKIVTGSIRIGSVYL